MFYSEKQLDNMDTTDNSKKENKLYQTEGFVNQSDIVTRSIHL